MYIYIYIYIYTHIYSCTCICIHVYTYTYIHTYIHSFIHSYIYIYICSYLSIRERERERDCCPATAGPVDVPAGPRAEEGLRTLWWLYSLHCVPLARSLSHSPHSAPLHCAAPLHSIPLTHSLTHPHSHSACFYLPLHLAFHVFEPLRHCYVCRHVFLYFALCLSLRPFRFPVLRGSWPVQVRDEA